MVVDVGPELVGKLEDVSFDPCGRDESGVWFNGGKVKPAKELDLSKRHTLLGPVQKKEEAKSSSKGSRYLKALQEKEQVRLRLNQGAVLFHKLSGDGDV